MNLSKKLTLAPLALSLCIASGNVLADAILPGECAFPEGVTATSDGTLYVGSMQHGSVFRVPAGSKQGEQFLANNANGIVSTLGVYADEERNRLIVCSADPGIAHTQVGDDSFTGKGGTGIHVFDLQSGVALSSVDFPGGGFCNDIAVDSRGAIFSTDTFHGKVMKYADGAISVLAMGGILSSQPWTLNGIDYRASDNALYVGNQSTGQLFKLSLDGESALSSIGEISLSRNLNVPDGLRFIDENTLGAVEAGAGALASISLPSGEVKVIAEGLDSPATFVPARGKMWVTSAQGGQFWTPDGSCAAVEKPFRVIEVDTQ